ncbi:MAG: carboxylesterase family protein [Prevotella sp.]|nr:carboxylesterase family protein [Prevotella sp.]
MKIKNQWAFAFLLSAAVFFPGKTVAQDNAENAGADEVITDVAKVTAETQYGKVAGYIQKGIYIYKGIPYAKAERFMAPVAPDAWTGVKSTRNYGAVAPHGVRTGWAQDEGAFYFNWDDGWADEAKCLNLNVWTPGLNDGHKRPVIVWFHGGGYAEGSSHEQAGYEGTNISKKGDVVFVSVNHRLNVLGFLDLSAYGDEYKSSGNAGLLDMVEALKWVHNNIANFGGDPSNVTIMGQSGGGGKVYTLCSTPAAKGLIAKAVVESGSGPKVMERKYSQLLAAETLKNLGLQPSDVAKLKTLPYEQLLEAGNKAIATLHQQCAKEGFWAFLIGWSPVVDGNILPHQPMSAETADLNRNIPFVIGTVGNEITGAFNGAFAKDDLTATEYLKKVYGAKADAFIAAGKKAYPQLAVKDLILVDNFFRPCAIEGIQARVAMGGAPVYNYLFTFNPKVMNDAFRCFHCSDIAFGFDNVARYSHNNGGSAAAVRLGSIMSNGVIAFARTGNPNAAGIPQWKPCTAKDINTMIFDTNLRQVTNFDKEMMDILNATPKFSF